MPDEPVLGAEGPGDDHSDLHPATVRLLAAGRFAMRKQARAQARLDREDRGTDRSSGFDWNAITWHEFAREQAYLSKWSPAAPRVSGAGLRNALAILSLLCREAERQEVTVAAKPVEGKISMKLDGQPLLVSIRELFADGEIQRTYREGRAVRTKVGTGRFVLAIDGAGSKFEIRDDQRGTLTSKILDGIFARMQQRRVSATQQARLQEKRDEEQYRAAAAALEEQQSRAAAARDAAAELERRAALVQDAERWRQALLVRRYVDYLARRAGPNPPPELKQWIAWARSVATGPEPPIDGQP